MITGISLSVDPWVMYWRVSECSQPCTTSDVIKQNCTNIKEYQFIILSKEKNKNIKLMIQTNNTVRDYTILNERRRKYSQSKT